MSTVLAPQEQAPPRRPEPWRAAFFGLAAVAVLAVAGWALLGSSLLVVRHVEVAGATPLVTAAQVRAAAAVPAGEPLSRVDTAAVARRVEQIGPVAAAKVTRSFPDAVVVTVRQRVPALALAARGGGYDLVDAAGVTVRAVRTLPAGMTVLSPAPASPRGSAAVAAAAGVVTGLPDWLRGQVASVSAPGGSVTLHLRKGATVAWGGAGQGAAKAAELKVLLATRASSYDVSDPATAVVQP